MRYGGFVSLAALLLAGGTGGFVLAQELREQPTGTTPAEPMSASAPARPVVPSSTLRPSSDRPGLDGRAPLAPAVLGRRGNRVEVLVPRGWRATPAAGREDEVRWDVPHSESGLHSVRVEVLDGNESPYQMVLGRAPMLEADSRVSDLDIRTDLGLVTDTIEYDFEIAQYLQRTIVRFVELDGSGQADVEIAWTGRPDRDYEGMLTLVQRMADSVRRVS